MPRPHNDRNRDDRRQSVSIDTSDIKLDITQDEGQLFGTTAENWAKRIEAEGNRQRNKINQIRSFYEKVIELSEKSEGLNEEQYKMEVFPYVVMLNSKAVYAKNRDLVSDAFVTMIQQCVKHAVNPEKMKIFKYFFEAFMGFYPKK